jgi:chromosome segregation ATPase
VDTVTSKLARAEEERDAALARIDALEADRAAADEAHQSSIAALESNLADIRDFSTKMQQEMSARASAKTADEVKELERERDELHAELHAVKTQLESSAAQASSSKSEDEFKELEHERDELQTELRVTRVAVAKLEDRLLSLKDEQARDGPSSSQLTEEIARLNAQVGSVVASRRGASAAHVSCLCNEIAFCIRRGFASRHGAGKGMSRVSLS